MVNPFLTGAHYDTETAIMLEKANVTDIGKAVAYTDGDRVFLNTEDNLYKLLPAYDDNMLKWLLWHERMHLELKHHNRFFKYVEEFEKEMETPAEAFSDEAIERHAKKFHITKDEVNIIMDILVHDWMSKKFPELVETAVNNLAQFRDRNSLKYTFKTNTLEEMLDEYSKHKEEEGNPTKDEDKKEGQDTKDEDKKEEQDTKDEDTKEEEDTKESKKESSKRKKKDEDSKPKEEDSKPKEEPTEPTEDEAEPESEHHEETDWSQLDNIDTKEFITKREGDILIDKINELRRLKLKLAKITSTLNSLVTTTRVRSYKTPSYIFTGQNTILKGTKEGKAGLYLCFDASGSMSRDMNTFKEIISKAIPQALRTPTVWFSGWPCDMQGDQVMSECRNDGFRNYDYYKGTFDDFMHISAHNGYPDDGDRTIELCYKAEQLGYSPIGITDGGGSLTWSIDMLKQLKRTVLVINNKKWLEKVQEANPNIQTIYTGTERRY